MILSKIALLASLAIARAGNVPPNLRSFYNTVRQGGDCMGINLLQGGFYDQDDGTPASWGYCQKNMSGKGFYLKGPGTQLANMDIDCDGQNAEGDGRCAGSDDTQYETRWKDLVQSYGIPDLNTYVHPYVVLGNEGNYSPTFDPREMGIEPLSVVAVVCGEKLVYGIWGDTNGDDGEPLVGEASLALATECFGSSMNADSGHDAADVLYIAFSGASVPGSNAKWDADTFAEFEQSISAMGDKLVAQLGG